MALWFDGRVIPFTTPIAERWGFLTAEQRKLGTSRPVVDGMIAATALEHGLTLITRNVKDFAGLGLPLLNPWKRHDD